jgi:glycosyltransferase involved in cell wall biosynthesis
VIGGGVNPAAATGGNGHRFRHKYSVRGPIVYHIGAAAIDKGTLDTIAAVRLLRARGLEVTFVMAGSTMLDRFRRRYEALPGDVREKCRWLGYISDQDKRDLAAAADVFCMPSRTESFGIVYLEAWLNGVPVIGARAGGVPDVISDGVDGFLVAFHDVDALAERIARLLTDVHLARCFGEAGRAKVIAHHTWERKIAKIASLYEDLVGARPAAGPGQAGEGARLATDVISS